MLGGEDEVIRAFPDALQLVVSQRRHTPSEVVLAMSQQGLANVSRRTWKTQGLDNGPAFIETSSGSTQARADEATAFRGEAAAADRQL